MYIDTLEPFSFTGKECAFGYRSSIFKGDLKGRVLITRVFFTLSTHPATNTHYGSIEQELQNQPDYSIQSIRRAVIAIRNQKLPDPQKVRNAGSFFKNPTVETSIAQKIKANYPNIPVYSSEIEGYCKLPAAFLIDQCGWKGIRRGNAGVHTAQPLVLVAFEGATGNEVLELSEQVKASVLERFGVLLEREVEVI
jgi:UDP-N-acetylmuramate dehydrogenase